MSQKYNLQVKKTLVVEKAGSIRNLAELLGITPFAISHWGEMIPSARAWQLMVLKPEWFER